MTAANYAYLAAPIDHGNLPSRWPDLRTRVAQELLTSETVTAIYRPDQAWQVGPEPEAFPHLQWVNQCALEAASVLVAFLPTGVPTIGTILEIQSALQLRIPTVLVLDEGAATRSFSLNHLLASHTDLCRVAEVESDTDPEHLSLWVMDLVQEQLHSREIPRRINENHTPWVADPRQEVRAWHSN